MLCYCIATWNLKSKKWELWVHFESIIGHMFASIEEMNYRQEKKRIIYLGLVIIVIVLYFGKRSSFLWSGGWWMYRCPIIVSSLICVFCPGRETAGHWC